MIGASIAAVTLLIIGGFGLAYRYTQERRIFWQRSSIAIGMIFVLGGIGMAIWSMNRPADSVIEYPSETIDIDSIGTTTSSP